MIVEGKLPNLYQAIKLVHHHLNAALKSLERDDVDFERTTLIVPDSLEFQSALVVIGQRLTSRPSSIENFLGRGPQKQ